MTLTDNTENTMDKIFLNDLNIDTIIGIYDWERQVLQTLTFDLEMDWDIREAAATEDINKTLDYDTIAKTLVAFVTASRYQLIETLAEDVCQLLLKQFPIPKIKLTLSKPVAIHGQNTARIVIERCRQ